MRDVVRLVLNVSEREQGERLDRLLSARVTGVSRSFAQTLMKEGSVLVNNQPAKPAYRVRAGDQIEVSLPPAESTEELEPLYLPIPVLYEDDDVIVFDKPAGLVTHPAPGHEHDTLVNALKAIRPDLQLRSNDQPGIVHRLDKDTSGLLVVAKHETARLSLLRQWQGRSVEKRYLALVHGVVEPDDGTIDAPINRDPGDRKRMAVVVGGRPAVTHFRVLERFTCSTLLELDLVTGRTHQIRVHLAFIGHPVIGDDLYGRRPFVVPVPRQFLHATFLRFRLPSTGKQIALQTPLPRDLQDVLETLRVREGVGA
jgi:23S rRNA pseudouridine1911/1915/1917 synthase